MVAQLEHHSHTCLQQLKGEDLGRRDGVGRFSLQSGKTRYQPTTQERVWGQMWGSAMIDAGFLQERHLLMLHSSNCIRHEYHSSVFMVKTFCGYITLSPVWRN